MFIPTTTLTSGGGAGDFSLIEDEMLGADAANFDFTGIPGTYAHLQLITSLRGVNAAGLTTRILFNNDTGTTYGSQRLIGGGVAVQGSAEINQTSGQLCLPTDGRMPAGQFGAGLFTIPNYASSTLGKQLAGTYSSGNPNASGDDVVGITNVNWDNTAAITQITLTPSAGNWLAGSRVTIYGLGT